MKLLLLTTSFAFNAAIVNAGSDFSAEIDGNAKPVNGGLAANAINAPLNATEALGESVNHIKNLHGIRAVKYNANADALSKKSDETIEIASVFQAKVQEKKANFSQKKVIFMAVFASNIIHKDQPVEVNPYLYDKKILEANKATLTGQDLARHNHHTVIKLLTDISKEYTTILDANLNDYLNASLSTEKTTGIARQIASLSKDISEDILQTWFKETYTEHAVGKESLLKTEKLALPGLTAEKLVYEKNDKTEELKANVLADARDKKLDEINFNAPNLVQVKKNEIEVKKKKDVFAVAAREKKAKLVIEEVREEKIIDARDVYKDAFDVEEENYNKAIEVLDEKFSDEKANLEAALKELNDKKLEEKELEIKRAGEELAKSKGAIEAKYEKAVADAEIEFNNDADVKKVNDALNAKIEKLKTKHHNDIEGYGKAIEAELSETENLEIREELKAEFDNYRTEQDNALSKNIKDIEDRFAQAKSDAIKAAETVRSQAVIDADTLRGGENQAAQILFDQFKATAEKKLKEAGDDARSFTNRKIIDAELKQKNQKAVAEKVKNNEQAFLKETFKKAEKSAKEKAQIEIEALNNAAKDEESNINKKAESAKKDAELEVVDLINLRLSEIDKDAALEIHKLEQAAAKAKIIADYKLARDTTAEASDKAEANVNTAKSNVATLEASLETFKKVLKVAKQNLEDAGKIVDEAEKATAVTDATKSVEAATKQQADEEKALVDAKLALIAAEIAKTEAEALAKKALTIHQNAVFVDEQIALENAKNKKVDAENNFAELQISLIKSIAATREAYEISNATREDINKAEGDFNKAEAELKTANVALTNANLIADNAEKVKAVDDAKTQVKAATLQFRAAVKQVKVAKKHLGAANNKAEAARNAETATNTAFENAGMKLISTLYDVGTANDSVNEATNLLDKAINAPIDEEADSEDSDADSDISVNDEEKEEKEETA